MNAQNLMYCEFFRSVKEGDSCCLNMRVNGLSIQTVTLTGHDPELNIREKPEKILVPLIEENGETWKMATSGSRYMFFEKLAIPMLSGSELLQKPDASDEIHDAVRKFSMLFVMSVIERLFWQGIIGSRMPFDLSAFALTCFDRHFQVWTGGPGEWNIAETRKHGTHRFSV